MLTKWRFTCWKNSYYTRPARFKELKLKCVFVVWSDSGENGAVNRLASMYSDVWYCQIECFDLNLIRWKWILWMICLLLCFVLKWRQTKAFPDLCLWCVYHIEPSNWTVKHDFKRNVDSWSRCDHRPMLVAYFRSRWYSDFFFIEPRYFLDKDCFSICGANPAGTDVCVGYLANATESTCALSDTRQSQLEQIQAIMVHFIGYILYPEAAVGCRFAVLVCSMIFFKASCPSRPPQTCHCSSACGCWNSLLRYVHCFFTFCFFLTLGVLADF